MHQQVYFSEFSKVSLASQVEVTFLPLNALVIIAFPNFQPILRRFAAGSDHS